MEPGIPTPSSQPQPQPARRSLQALSAEWESRDIPSMQAFAEAKKAEGEVLKKDGHYYVVDHARSSVIVADNKDFSDAKAYRISRCQDGRSWTPLKGDALEQAAAMFVGGYNTLQQSQEVALDALHKAALAKWEKGNKVGDKPQKPLFYSVVIDPTIQVVRAYRTREEAEYAKKLGAAHGEKLHVKKVDDAFWDNFTRDWKEAAPKGKGEPPAPAPAPSPASGQTPQPGSNVSFGPLPKPPQGWDPDLTPSDKKAATELRNLYKALKQAIPGDPNSNGYKNLLGDLKTRSGKASLNTQGDHWQYAKSLYAFVSYPAFDNDASLRSFAAQQFQKIAQALGITP